MTTATAAIIAAKRLTPGTRVRFTDLVPWNYWFKPGAGAEVTGTVRVVRRTRSGLPISVEVDGAAGRPLAHVEACHVEVIPEG